MLAIESTRALLNNVLTSRIYDQCLRTPLDFLPTLSAEIGNSVWVKREDLQPVFSFKLRGAYHKISKADPASLKYGVIAASAGNHAQGVAYSALQLGLSAKIFMPVSTTMIKINAVKMLKADIVLSGETLLESSVLAKEEARLTGALYIDPFNDIDVVTGQASVGLEILQDAKEIPDAIFVPIGGGGLISGIAAVIKSLRPSIAVIGVEPCDSNVMTQSIAKKSRVKLNYLNPFADGVAIKEVGEITFDFCQKYVDDYINVNTDEICSATKIMFNDLRAIPEPSGALALAGLLKYAQTHHWQQKNLVSINTGANIDFERLRFIADRAKIGEGKEMLLGIKLAERPGILKEFCQKVLKGVKISEFNYRLNDPKLALIFLGLEIVSDKDQADILASIKNLGYACYDLTANEIAKSHLKYMIGGRSSLMEQERVFQFQFPENRYAISQFLDHMAASCNISLLHYRNYGGDYAKLLVGIQSSGENQETLNQFLADVPFSYREETNNEIYHSFINF